MSRIELVYFNAGGGHRAAARALEAAVKKGRPSWELRSVNLFDVLDPQQRWRRLAGIEPEDYYNLRLKKGWTAGLAKELKFLQAGIRLAHGYLVERLMPHWVDGAPDLVVSLIPNFNRPLIESVSLARPGVPYLTVMTDLADYPPNFWIEPGTVQHLVCGTARAAEQARAAGVGEERIHRVSGMVLHPDFYGPELVDLSAERESLGLDPTQPVGIVMFGGHGAPAMEAIARELDDVQLILLCGHNAKLAARLRGMKARAPRAVVGYTPHVRKFMQLGDFFIGKPGPGSLSEAVHMGLPVITFGNASTMPQERYNTEWVRESGVGLVVKSSRVIGPAVHDMLDRIDLFRRNVGLLRNSAVFEVVEVMEFLLRSSAASEIEPTASAFARQAT
jgi:hypothetical protein